MYKGVDNGFVPNEITWYILLNYFARVLRGVGPSSRVDMGYANYTGSPFESIDFSHVKLESQQFFSVQHQFSISNCTDLMYKARGTWMLKRGEDVLVLVQLR
ncbi:hypothetical protein Ahy_B07g088503 isoform E [Arachis hypogaea]|nr:hypothetical protein Ahy_B07g088503 isoform E [Arachis hypogaea]